MVVGKPQLRKRLVSKRAKPKAAIQQSFLFQAEKALAKTVKLLKVFLLRKLLRKLADTKASISNSGSNSSGTTSSQDKNRNVESSTSIASCDTDMAWLDSLKKANHTDIAKLIAVNSFPDCYSSTTVSCGSSETEQKVYRRMVQHKKIAELLSTLRTKYEAMVAKNNLLRAAEQRQQDKTRNASSAQASRKNIVSKRAIDKNEISRSLFCDSLQATAEEEESRHTRQKPKDGEGTGPSEGGVRQKKNVRPPSRVRRERKQKQQQQYKEGDALPIDMAIYQPVEQRPLGTATSTAEYIQRFQQPDGSLRRAKISANSKSAAIGSVSQKPSQTSNQAVAETASMETVKTGKDWKATGVHPSWAAKQLTKKSSIISIPSSTGTGTKQYTGLSFAKQPTKIVFDD